MAQTHLNTLITNAGLTPEDIEAIIALPEEGTDFNADEYVGKIRTSVETQVRNDPKFWETLDENNVPEPFKKRIEAQQYGRAANIVRQKALKAMGFTEADVSDFSEEERKSLETFITKVSEKYATTKSSDKQLQGELVELRKRYEALEASVPEKEGVLKQEYEGRLQNEKLNFIILSELSGIEGLPVPVQYVQDKISDYLKNEFNFELQGMKAMPKQKANKALDVLDGAKVMTLRDLIVKKLTADGLLKTGGGEPPKPSSGKFSVEPNGDGTLGISSHIMARIEANS